MADDKTKQTGQANDDGTGETNPPNPSATQTDPPSTDPKKDTYEGLPDEFAWVKDKITELNRENASYRTKYQETKTQLDAARDKTEAGSDERKRIDELIAANEKVTQDLSVERAMRVAKLDDEFAFLLEPYKGSDDETILKAAKTFAALKGGADDAPPPPRTGTRPPATGGLNPHQGTKATGAEAYKQFRENQRNY